MFARRKRKAEDDEPLVPHGLIWQATEDLMPPKAESITPKPSRSDSPEPAAATARPPLAKPLEILAKRALPAANSSDPAVRKPPESDPVSQPLPWPSMNVKNALRRPPVSDSNLAPNFWVSRPPERSLPQNPRPTLVSPNPGSNHGPAFGNVEVQNVASTKQSGKNAGPSPWQHSVGFFREIGHAAAELCANARLAYKERHITEQIQRARERAHVRLVQEKSTFAKLRIRLQEVKARSRSAVLQVSSATRDRTTLVQNRASAMVESSGNFARRVLSRRLRVRLAAARQLRLVIANSQEWRDQATRYFRQNSRLAVSMVMAGFSAVLMLALIGMVGRYQPNTDAGTRSTQSQGPNSGSHSELPLAAPVTVKRLVVADPKATPAAKSPMTTKATSQEPGVQQPAPSRRIHHNEDEDYVAKDTYVYYGNRGRSSR